MAKSDRVLRIFTLILCLLLLQTELVIAATTTTTKSSRTPTRTHTSTHTPSRTSKSSKTSKTSSTTSSSTFSGSVPIYTWQSAATVKGCPAPLPTSNLQTFTLTDTNAVPQATAYAGPTGAVVPQVYVVNPQNSTQQVVYVFKNTSRIEMHYQYGKRSKYVVDERGARIYTSDCSTQISLNIGNTTEVVNAYGDSSSSSGRRRSASRVVRLPADKTMEKRESDTYFPWTVSYLDQCGNPVTADHNATAQCFLSNYNINFDAPPTNVNLKSSGSGVFHGTCVVPVPSDAEKECEDTVKGILDWPTQGLVGQLTNVKTDLAVIGAIVASGSLKRLAALVASAFEIPEVAAGVAALAVYQGFIAIGGDNLVANNYCPLITNFQNEVEAKLDVESSQANINYQMTAPFTSFAVTRTVSISTISSCTTSTSSAPIETCTDPSTQQYAGCSSPLTGCGGYYSCGPYDQNCLCSTNIDGSPMCFPYGFCIAPDCSSDADCPCGGACLQPDTCCQRAICVDITTCANGAQKVKEYFELAPTHPEARPIANVIWEYPGVKARGPSH